MTAMTEERTIFENEEWLVVESGLEHKATGYFIERESIGNRRDDGLWAWPLHMAEKSWCAMMPFVEAFSCAAAVYNVRQDADLAQTFKIARCEIAPWPHREEQAFNPASPVPGALQARTPNPILVEPGSAEKPSKGQGFQNPKDVWRMRSQAGARPFSTTERFGSSPHAMRASITSWQARHRFRKTGTKLVRLLQAAWNMR